MIYVEKTHEKGIENILQETLQTNKIRFHAFKSDFDRYHCLQQKEFFFYYPPTKRRRGKYKVRPECTVQAENIGIIFGLFLLRSL